MRYRVHIYAVARVPVEVDADSPVEAVKKAESLVDLYSCLSSRDCEFAEEVVDYLVDELDEQGNFVKSAFLNADEVYNQ